MLVVEGVEDIRCGVEEHLEEEEGLEEEGEAEGEEIELGSGGNQLIASMMEKMFSKDFYPDSTQTWMYSHGHRLDISNFRDFIFVYEETAKMLIIADASLLLHFKKGFLAMGLA